MGEEWRRGTGLLKKCSVLAAGIVLRLYGRISEIL
jgi:hypothetical protein